MAGINSSEEQKRLQALYSYHILDTAQDKDYDDVTTLAAAICNTPIALISFVDMDRQWFKSHYGLDVEQTDRCYSFCSHAIQNPENLMQIEDAQLDHRFQDNPLVTGSPNIRFYAGMPLVDNQGVALGTLCVIDQKPRYLTEIQQMALQTLAQQVIDKLSLKKSNEKLRRINQELIETNARLTETESKLQKANSELAESKERLQTILDIMVEGVGITDEKGNITYTNKRNREIFQLDEPSMLTLNNVSNEWNNRRLDGSRLPDEEHPVTVALRTGSTVINHEFIVRNPQYDSVYLRMNAVPMKDTGGKIIGAIASFNDVTESFLLQQKLKEKELRLQAAISSANLGTWQINAHTKEMEGSTRMKEILGFHPDENISYDCAILQIAETHRQKVIDLAKASLTKNGSSEIEYPITGYHDKQKRWVRSTFYKHTDAGNNIPFLAGTIADITESKLNEQRRIDFVGMVSHELRNPLTSVKVYVNMLQRTSKKNNDQVLLHHMDKVASQVERMEILINGFLDVARLGEAKININKIKLDILTLFQTVEKEVNATINSHQIIFEPNESILIEADKDKIEQVVINFINNAVKYSPERTIITISFSIRNGMAYVLVKDQGMGIAPSNQPFIFDRFYRVESEAMKQKKGFGIGLYICKEIIENHNGIIGVDSSEDSGSTFWFGLPIVNNIV